MQQNPLIKEYLDIAFRRKWWIVIPTIVGVLFSVALYFRFPKLYQAETRVQIRTQTISRKLLESVIEVDYRDLVTQINSQITSERYVQELNDALNLVGAPGGPKDLTELAKMLDRAIELDSNPRDRYFTLKVTWKDPRIAAEIANELAQIYIRRNEEIRGEMAGATLDQLRAKREDVQRKLNAVRRTIQEFRSKHKFELATYQGTNEQLFERNTNEIEQIGNAIRDHNNEIQRIEIQLNALETDPTASPSQDPRVAQLRQLRSELADYVEGRGYTDAHPKVQALRRSIDVLEKELSAGGGEGGASGVGTDLTRAEYEQEVRRHKAEIQALKKKQERLVTENKEIQRRLERTPDSQNELDRYLQREKNLAQLYADAYAKELAALEGADVEEFQAGERFEILNMARKPSKPFWPDLRLFLMMGVAVGAGLGIGIVLLLEVFDQSFKSEEQLAASVDLPILAVIPDLNRASERAQAKRGKPKVRRRKAG